MSLSQLIYVSDVADGVNVSDVSKIVESAKVKNYRRGLTGFLMFGPNHFLQLLEGGSESVNQVYCRIVADRRHVNPTLIGYRPVAERAFPNWGMNFASLIPDKQSVYFRYTACGEFLPRQLSYESARSLLIDMSELSHESHREQASQTQVDAAQHRVEASCG